MAVEANFAKCPESVALARRFAEEALGGVPAPITIDIVLMVSELATNAVVHACTTFSLRIERTDKLVRVEVVDEGDGQARRQSPSPGDLHGRGLQLVESLSDEWGTGTTGDRKNAVWFVRKMVTGETGRRDEEGVTQGRAGKAVAKSSPTWVSNRGVRQLYGAPIAV